MSVADGSAVAVLGEVDAAIEAVSEGRRHSLAPSRSRAHSYVAVLEAVCPPDDPLRASLAAGLAGLGRAQLHHFPENLLWDVDLLVGEFVRAAGQSQRPSETLAASFETLIELHARYGVHTEIRFRYVHDFAYGYDWAKWVARDPDARRDVRPFDPAFLQHMLDRADELRALIAADDTKYPRLVDGRARNPFPFSREPADELRLHRSLAAYGELPIPAWEADPGDVAWDRPWAELRVQRADKLGLMRAR